MDELMIGVNTLSDKLVFCTLIGRSTLYSTCKLLHTTANHLQSVLVKRIKYPLTMPTKIHIIIGMLTFV